MAAKACQKSSTSSLSNSPILGLANCGVETEVVPAGKVDGGRRQRLFHRQREVAIAADAGFVAEGLLHRLAQADADVLDRVVLIDVQIALGLDRQIESPVPREQLQHVVEKADARFPRARAAAVEVQLQADLGFAGGAVDVAVRAIFPFSIAGTKPGSEQ